jgi:hypothetical protein
MVRLWPLPVALLLFALTAAQQRVLFVAGGTVQVSGVSAPVISTRLTA